MGSDLSDMLDRLKERGCPKCGAEVISHTVAGPNAISLEPCGHTVGAL